MVCNWWNQISNLKNLVQKHSFKKNNYSQLLKVQIAHHFLKNWLLMSIDYFDYMDMMKFNLAL